MMALRCAPLVLKQVLRQRVRSVLTIAGIAIAMFLFTAVQAMQRGVSTATKASASETTLVVYRADRFCPATSRLPQDYERRIASIEGVASVTPVKVVVSNCRTSLDVVTFRGVPKESFLAGGGRQMEIVSGSVEDWLARTDAALVGEALAVRRGLRPGMRFSAAGITAYVAGVMRSDDPQDQNVALTALEFVQLAGRNELGVVTQFSVTVREAGMLEPVARAIDDTFATAQDPTATFSEKAFIGKLAGDIIELVEFARWLGMGCLVAVLALVGNAIVLGVQSRVSEHAVLQTLGFTGPLVAMMIVGEGVLLSLLGGLLGAMAAVGAARLSGVSLSVEGVTIPVSADAQLLAVGLVVCGVIGIVAGLVPAWQASRREIAACLRAA